MFGSQTGLELPFERLFGGSGFVSHAFADFGDIISLEVKLGLLFDFEQYMCENGDLGPDHLPELKFRCCILLIDMTASQDQAC